MSTSRDLLLAVAIGVLMVVLGCGAIIGVNAVVMAFTVAPEPTELEPPEPRASAERDTIDVAAAGGPSTHPASDHEVQRVDEQFGSTPKPPPPQGALGAFQPIPIASLFRNMGDYDPPTGHFEVIAVAPVMSIRVGAATIESEYPDVRLQDVQRSAVDAVLLAFTFSDVDTLRVTSQPLLLSFDGRPPELLKEPTVVLEVDRDAVLRHIAQAPDISSFADLRLGPAHLEALYEEPLSPQEYDSLPVAMKYAADKTSRFCFNDAGPPTLAGTVEAFTPARP